MRLRTKAGGKGKSTEGGFLLSKYINTLIPIGDQGQNTNEQILLVDQGKNTNIQILLFDQGQSTNTQKQIVDQVQKTQIQTKSKYAKSFHLECALN